MIPNPTKYIFSKEFEKSLFLNFSIKSEMFKESDFEHLFKNGTKFKIRYYIYLVDLKYVVVT